MSAFGTSSTCGETGADFGFLLLGHWDCPAESIDLIAHEDNAVFDVKSGARRWALRLGAEDGWPAAEQQAEMEWLARLTQAGSRVPSPVVTRSGEWGLAIGLDGLLRERPCVLLEWVNGEPPERGLTTDDDRVGDIDFDDCLITTLGFIVSSTNHDVRSWCPARLASLVDRLSAYLE